MRAPLGGGLSLQHRLEARGLQRLQQAGSGLAVPGLSRCEACGVSQHQGSEPCFLHWQGDSHPLSTREVLLQLCNALEIRKHNIVKMTVFQNFADLT